MNIKLVLFSLLLGGFATVVSLSVFLGSTKAAFFWAYLIALAVVSLHLFFVAFRQPKEEEVKSEAVRYEDEEDIEEGDEVYG